MRRALVAAVAVVLVLAACSGRSNRQTVLPPLPTSIPRADTTIPAPVTGCLLAQAGSGAEVQAVTPGSAAEGVVLAGDVIVAVDGLPVATSADLVAAVREHAPGMQVVVSVERNGNDVDLELVLGENPDVAGGPLLGVEVVTPITTYSPPALPASPEPVLGPFVRGIAMDGIIYLLDPVAGRWQPYSDAPATSWAAIRNGIYTIRPEGTDGALVELVGTDFRVSLDAAGWDVPSLASSIDGLGIAFSQRTPEDPVTASPGVEPAVLAIDPQTGTIVWTWAPELNEDEAPLFAFASPSHDRVVILLGSIDTQETTGHIVLGPDGEELTGWPDQGRFLPPGSLVIGWFDGDSLLYAVPPGPGLFAFNLTTRDSIPVTVSDDVGAGTVLWAVGDGEHLIALAQDQLLLLDTAGSELRPLAFGCVVAGVGDAGALTG